MSDVFGLVEKIVSIIRAIKTQAEALENNKAQAKRLTDRMDVIAAAIRGLDEIPDNTRFMPALQKIYSCLGDAQSFLTKLSHKGSFKLFFKAGKYQNRFEEINKALQEACIELGLATSVQTIFNHEQDRADELADNAQMMTLLQLEYETKQNMLVVAANSQQLQVEMLELKAYLAELTRLQAMISAIAADVSAIRKTQARACDVIDVGVHRLAGMAEESKEAHCDLLEGQYRLFQQLADLRQLLLEQSSRSTAGSVVSRTTVSTAIDISDVTMEQHIGYDCFGCLQLGRYKGQQVLIKARANVVGSQRQLAEIVGFMQTIRHPHVALVYGVGFTESNCFLVLEDLPYDFAVVTRLDEAAKQTVAINIAQGLDCLHSHNVVHGNLTSQNIRFDKHQSAKITNFCLATTLTTTVSNVATYPVAPELLTRGAEVTRASDVYSYGILLLDLYKPNHLALPQCFEYLSTQPELIEIAPPLLAVIQQALVVEPERRISLPSLVARLGSSSPTPAVKPMLLEAAKAEPFQVAFSLHKKAAVTEEPAAQLKVALGYLRDRTPTKERQREAITLLQRIINSRTDSYTICLAAYNLGQCYEYGIGCERDLLQALAWYNQMPLHAVQITLTYDHDLWLLPDVAHSLSAVTSSQAVILVPQDRKINCYLMENKQLNEECVEIDNTYGLTAGSPSQMTTHASKEDIIKQVVTDFIIARRSKIMTEANARIKHVNSKIADSTTVRRKVAYR